MRRVERPMWEPYRCAMTLKDQDPEGFLVGEVIKGFDPHAFVAVSWVKQTATELGYLSPEEGEVVATALEQAEHRVAQLEQEVDELNRDFEAIDVLQSRGYTARRKQGRPKTKQEA